MAIEERRLSTVDSIDNASSSAAKQLLAAAQDLPITELGTAKPLLQPNKEVFDEALILRKPDGSVLKVNHKKAMKLAEELRGELPSARDTAWAMNPQAILEEDYIKNELKGAVPKGFYSVPGEDAKGKRDVFYFNNDQSPELPGELAKNSYWTSTYALGKRGGWFKQGKIFSHGYAHVFYGQLRGGGGEKEDHRLDTKHAVLVIRRRPENKQ